jgi:hypothetical protein
MIRNISKLICSNNILTLNPIGNFSKKPRSKSPLIDKKQTNKSLLIKENSINELKIPSFAFDLEY